MGRRAMWKGVVSFRKIRVPVKMYAAVESTGISFHLLHAKDHVRLRQQMVCGLENEPVPSEEIVKGLEVDENEYVLLEPDDLAELEPEMDRSIAVTSFVDTEEVDPRYFDRPYHLGPDGDATGYASLVEALGSSGRLGICHWSFRKRFYNGALGARDGVLELVTLRLGDEVVETKTLDLPEVGLTQKELKTATYLVEELTGTFDPTQYRDDFQKELLKLIETKAKGGKVSRRKVKEPKATDSKSLSALLEASLDEVRGRQSAADPKKKAQRKSA